MNEELKDEEIILDGQVKESLTYEVYEDNAGGLHMSIFEEDVKTAELLAICYNIKPQDVKACIADLEEYRNWEGIVLRENEEGRDIMEENHALAVSCEIIDETYVAAGLGLRRERIKNLDKWETWEDLISCPYNLHNFLMLGTIPLLFTMIDEEGLTEISLEEPVKELIYGKH